MGRRVWTWMSAPPPSRAASAVSIPTAPTSACVWTATRPWSETQTRAKPCPVSSPAAESRTSKQFQISRHFLTMCLSLILAEEPFLIMADHHEIRKLSVDGSNYTILKQVSEVTLCILAAGSFFNLCDFLGSTLITLKTEPRVKLSSHYTFFHFLCWQFQKPRPWFALEVLPFPAWAGLVQFVTKWPGNQILYESVQLDDSCDT